MPTLEQGARDYDPATGQFLTVDPALEDTRQPYAYTGNSPLLRTDPTGMDWFSDMVRSATRELSNFARDAAPVLANLGAAALGFADEMTGGASTALLRAINPDVDCFIDAHKDAFGAGQVVGVITTVVVAVASIVVTGGAATGAVVGVLAVKMAVKKSLKEALVVGVKRNTDEVASAATRSATPARAAAARTTVDDAASSCSVNSFTADTPVAMADGSSKPISEVEVGDEVVATDPEAGRTESRPVSALIRHGGEHTMVDVALEDGSLITATDRHPFWDASTGEFTYAIDLEEGELVLALDGSTLRIASVQVHGEDLIAYNLEIEGIHTYYAGETPVLVHNTCELDLDAMSASGSRQVGNQGEQAVGQKITQHAGQGAFPPSSAVVGNAASRNSIGQSVLDDILTHPGTRVVNVNSGNFAGGVRLIDPSGRGATFDAGGLFRYFGVY